MDGTPKASKAYASTCLVGEHFATPAGLPMEVHGVIGRMRDSAVGMEESCPHGTRNVHTVGPRATLKGFTVNAKDLVLGWNDRTLKLDG